MLTVRIAAQLAGVPRAQRTDVRLEALVGPKPVPGASLPPPPPPPPLRPQFGYSLVAVQLIDRQTEQVVAQSEGASITRCMGIAFLAEVAPLLDTLVLSFIICEDDRREQETLLAPTAVSGE